MAISVQCDGCDKRFKVKDEFAGKKVRCPGCRASVVAPDPEDDEAGDDRGGRGVPWGWIAAGVATALFLFTLGLAIVGHVSSGSLRDELAAAERRGQEADALKKERAALEEKVRGLNAELDKLRLQLAAVELQQKGGEPAKAPAPPVEKPAPVAPAAAQDPALVRKLLVGRWQDVKNGKPLADGKSWGEMEFTADGQLAVVVRDTATAGPAVLAGTYRVLDDGRAEITVSAPAGVSAFDTPPWATVDLGAALLGGTPHTMPVAVAVGPAELTFAGVAYRRGPAGPSLLAGMPPPMPKPAPAPTGTAQTKPDPKADAKAGPRATKIVRARRLDTGDGNPIVPTAATDVVLLLKIEGAPATVTKDGLALFRNSYVMAGKTRLAVQTMTVSAQGGGPVWVGVVIPSAARTVTVHLAGRVALPVNLPTDVVESAKVGN